MKIGIFAASETGYEIVKLFVERNINVECLVLDDNDEKKWIDQMINTKVSRNIFFNTDLQKKDILSKILEMNIDIIILAWWPYIIKKEMLNLAIIGFLNTHPSYIPYNRGKHYYFWNLVENVKYGATLHFINEDIDSGQIAFQKIIDVTWEDTGYTLREKGKLAIVDLLKNSLNKILSGDIPRQTPDLSVGTYHSGKELNLASKIDLDRLYNAKDILNIIRGRSGFPVGGAWFIHNNEKYEIQISIKKINNEK